MGQGQMRQIDTSGLWVSVLKNSWEATRAVYLGSESTFSVPLVSVRAVLYDVISLKFLFRTQINGLSTWEFCSSVVRTSDLCDEGSSFES